MASEIEKKNRDTRMAEHVRKPFKCKVTATSNETTRWRKLKSWTLGLINDVKHQ